jgi:tetratricopeptide (TPR) repeat protein
MALADSRRFAEAAQVAGDILRTWPEDAYAQRTGAALLSESRNGQEALNAAWNGVRVAPAEAEAHLVLALVAARLRLFDLAQRAYAEALDLDPAIGDAVQDVGVVRLERRRWARALEELAEEASLGAGASTPEPEEGEHPPAARPNWSEPPAVSRPSRPVLDVSADSAGAVLETIRYGANGTLVAAVLTAAMTLVSPGISRAWASLIGILVFAAVILWFRSRLSEPAGAVLARLRSRDRPLAAALYLTFAAPLFLVAYAAVGGLPMLVVGMVLAAVADLVVLTGRR